MDPLMRTKQRRQAPWPASSHPSDLRAAEPENDDRVLRAELGLVGSSPAFVDAFVQARRFANCMAPVMIRGQTGNGKELFARAIHCLGARAAGPFIPINCGAIPDALLESELFGHVRGAFTDARGDRAGLVALAGGGTLFLDEVDSLSAKAQVTLLRFLQDHEYRPVGAGTIAHADVRVLSATNADVDAALANGVFRSDLLFRLDVLALTLPPLAQRREDIVVLARHFLGRFAGVYSGQAPQLDADAAQWLAAQPWPGNVRQLENLMHRAYVLGSGGRIRRADLTPAIDCAEPMASGLFEGGLKEARRRWLREFEHAYLQRLLAQTHGNVTEAAQRSGMERRAMGRLLVRNGIDKGRFR